MASPKSKKGFESSDPKALSNLEREVAARKQRLLETGQVTVAHDGSGIVSVADIIPQVMPELQAAGKRVEEKIVAFRRELRQHFGEPPPRTCPEHPGEKEAVDWDASFQKSWRDTQLQLVYSECAICKHERLVNERHKRWLAMGIPRKVSHATFENYRTDIEPKREALAAVRRQAEKGRGFILLYGHPGNGKSHLAAAFLKAAGGGKFITHSDLADELRLTYDEGGKTKLLKKYREAPALVIDELDKDVKGDDIVLLLYSILAYRYENDLPTGLTSNHDLPTIKTLVGPRLADRMSQNYVAVPFTWESYRKQHREV